MLLQTIFEGFGIKNNRQKMNTVYFFEIKQDRDRRPENFPVEPFAVGKTTNYFARTQYVKGLIGKL